MDGKLTLGLSGVLSLAGLGLLAQEAQANPEAARPEPDRTVALAPDPHPTIVPAPAAQTSQPETDELDPQPAWTPSVDDDGVMAAAALPDGDPIAPGSESPPLVPAEILELSQAPKLEMPALLEAVASDPSASDPSAVIGEAIAPSPTPEVAPSPEAETEVALETAKPPDSALERVSTEPMAAIAAATPPTPTGSATELQPITNPVVANPVVANPTAPTATAIPPEPGPPATPGAATPTVGETHPAAGLPAAPRFQRPAAADVAALRARSQAIAALLEDVRSAAGLEASIAASPASTVPHRQVTPPEIRSQGPQLPPLPGRGSLRNSQIPAPLSETAIAKPTPKAATTLQSRRSPQLPTLPGKTIPQAASQTSNVALALPTPQPAMTPATTAQATPATARPAAIEPDSIRDELRIAPLTTTANPARTYAPAPNAGIPSAFGANWGDLFISASLAGADRLRPEADGSLSMGFGLGDARQAVGVELAYNLLSVRNFAANGSFDIKVHREVYASDQNQVATAVGVANALRYGSDTATTAASLYGVVTAAQLLQPDHPSNRLPLTATLGIGGGNFAADSSDVGVLAGVGLQVHPQFSLNTAWSGVGVNVGASIVPVSRIPLSLNLLYGDIGNHTRAGSVAVISIGYGYSSTPRF